jgi:hypothetical protein
MTDALPKECDRALIWKADEMKQDMVERLMGDRLFYCRWHVGQSPLRRETARGLRDTFTGPLLTAARSPCFGNASCARGTGVCREAGKMGHAARRGGGR